ncbi:FAD-dependent oxidoreductase [Sphingomicrobium clamense]|uniref:FAD-dependent oxidoreductase n=1 Tax=Sphingomicrobium clamense TaxID=2851013 RepID=A0ABS6V5F0_9SPHN|nr:FAD-dependent oxidoreductase [Sphingomicrobium sp. B8]MBW0144777.1 FAD-dependent oxidoreductase [Sphingomicrobium sp. B8]
MNTWPLTRRQILGGIGAGALAPSIVRARSLGSDGHAVVVGAGVFGTWTARALMDAGMRVTLIDKHGPANARASSAGETRMTRAGYGADAIYAKMALDSLKDWKALSDRAALPLFHPHGVLFFFDEEIDYFTDTIRVHREMGLPTQVLTPAQMARRYPMIDFDGVAIGMFEPDFGAIMARRSVQTLVAEMVKEGLVWRRGQAKPVPMPRGPSPLPGVDLMDGERVEGDAYIYALGPWLPQGFPDVLDRRIVTSRQEVFFFAPPEGDDRFAPQRLPGWAHFESGDLHYGFPDIEARGAKICFDNHGPEVDPDTNPRRVTKEGLAEIVAYRDRVFPALRGAQLLETRVCQYENSSNGDFLIDRHPGHPNVTLVGAGSGHGFKHGPSLGRLAAQIAMGGEQDQPRFTLATKETTQARSVI